MRGYYVFFSAAWIILAIVTVVDVNRYPEQAFRAVGSSRTTWIVWPIVGALFCGFVTLGFAIAWFSSKKAQVGAALAQGHGGGFGPPSTTGWQPPDQGGWQPPDQGWPPSSQPPPSDQPPNWPPPPDQPPNRPPDDQPPTPGP